MPHVVREFNWVLHPILVLGPSTQSLKTFFEEIAFELTTELGADENVGLRSFAVPGPGPLAFWMSANLGKRGKGVSRISVLGLSLEGDLGEIRRLFPLVDGGILLAKQENATFEKLFKTEGAGAFADLPWVYYAEDSKGESFHLKALRQWVGNEADRVLWNPRANRILEDSLTWILEESA